MKQLPRISLLIVFLALSLLILPSLLASPGDGLLVDIHLGLLSGAGVLYDTGIWQLGLDLETTFPVWCIGSGMVAEKYDEPFWQAFRLGLTDFIGADAYAYVKLLDGKAGRIYAGLDIMFGTEPPIKSFEMILRPTTKIVINLGERTSLFAAGGFSLLEFIIVPGFSKPLFGIPEVSWATILTGCRLGLDLDVS